MSIDHLKKQSKNLKRLWPEFSAAHGATPTLAACQELIARCSGYASWHAAVSSGKDKTGREESNAVVAFPAAAVNKVTTTLTAEVYQAPGHSEDRQVEFKHSDRSLLGEVSGQLDAYLESHEGLFDDVVSIDASAKREGLRGLESLCRDLVSQDNDFIDGYAHMAAAMVELHRPAEAVQAGSAAFGRACALVEAHGQVVVPYHNLPNRGFHRLAHSLALAHIAMAKTPGPNREAEKQRALAIIEKMLAWWPNDNMGFRFLRPKCKPAAKKAA